MSRSDVWTEWVGAPRKPVDHLLRRLAIPGAGGQYRARHPLTSQARQRLLRGLASFDHDRCDSCTCRRLERLLPAGVDLDQVHQRTHDAVHTVEKVAASRSLQVLQCASECLCPGCAPVPGLLGKIALVLRPLDRSIRLGGRMFGTGDLLHQPGHLQIELVGSLGQLASHRLQRVPTISESLKVIVQRPHHLGVLSNGVLEQFDPPTAEASSRSARGIRSVSPPDAGGTPMADSSAPRTSSSR